MANWGDTWSTRQEQEPPHRSLFMRILDELEKEIAYVDKTYMKSGFSAIEYKWRYREIRCLKKVVEVMVNARISRGATFK